MKKKVAILGSTGSIGQSLLKILYKNKSDYEVKLLSAQKNYKLLFRQANIFKVKNLIITDKKYYNIAKSKKNKSINIYNNFEKIEKIFPKKIDYVMSSIVGIDGLRPTIKIIKYTKTIAIANKESIICAWNLIKDKLAKYNTKFIPVDSEHYSIWHALNNNIDSQNVKKIYLTASGGPLLNIPKKNFNKMKLNYIVKHPNWSMGKKISVDSSNLMNKVFEVIEAKKLFNVNYDQIDILIHPDSYIHAIIYFKNKMISIIAHDTTMDIPIANTLDRNKKNIYLFKNNSFNLNLKKLNNLTLKKVNQKKFPLTKILEILPEHNSLFETVLVSANDKLVDLYLNKKIKYIEISNILFDLINSKEMKKFKKMYPKKISDIYNVHNIVQLKINSIFS
ncbi:1-deoxy-D-xylulose-5-phosphate reductoisomerase [Candidatus Pelagibacter sp. HIMB1485]|uniref:1-deoxy-D-xylulose-5-phosphate reductoisomerase n=1 Tax=Candidatus Pelagibacter sp. HIMB1485 TaxID=3415415 RepID=UPI003F849375